ncbi:hypothetical protein [Zavarzinella formosa]|uniref:hypothetical protein n=1 Tax=Zavarzinella formosa TaxID=360055 RepID=UPI0012F7A26D|nr:hypothetical protein [Zavarzinella formosa]
MRAIAGVKLLAVAGCLCLTAGVRADDGKDDTLRGKWNIVGMVYRGQVQDFGGPTGGTMTITDGKLQLKYLSYDTPSEWAIAIQPSVIPRRIDVRLPHDDERRLGIYELKDGVLRIIFARPGDDRPKDFDARKDEKLILYTLKRPSK